MANIDITTLAQAMVAAAKGVLDQRFPEVRSFVEIESKTFMTNIAEIERMRLTGEIDETQARILVRMHRRSMETVWAAVEGVSLALAEQAVNAAIAAVKEQANAAIGFALL